MSTEQMLEKGVLKKILGAGTKAIPYIGQANLGKQILSKVTKQALGYDFISLLQKLAFFYAFAFLIIKYFEAVLGASLGMQAFAKLVGINLNPALPDSVIKFFSNGLILRQANPAKNIGELALKPWDIVSLLAFFLLIAEAVQYFEDNKKQGRKLSWFTVGVWGLLIAGVGLVTIVPLLQKLKGPKQQSASDLLGAFGQPPTSTMNFAITILNPVNNQSQDFIMTPAQVVSIPETFFVTAGPKLTSSPANITDATFQTLFGVPVNPAGKPSTSTSGSVM